MLVAVDAIPAEARRGRKRKRLTIARGEMTGHSHVLEAPEIEEYATTDRRLVRLPLGGRLSHEEHAALELAPGDYEVRLQHEYTPPSIGRVSAASLEQIALRELRNQTSRILRRVEAGERLTVTIDGRPVVDLVPHSGRRRFLSRDELVRLLEARRPTPDVRRDVRQLVPDTTDDV